MKKTLSFIFGTIVLIGGLSVLKTVNAADYPYPQNYTLDQRRFDSQQAANLIMRRLQPSTTGQWAIATVNLESGSGLGLYISTASYGSINAVGNTVINPGYAVKRFSVLSVGGLNSVKTNKTDGSLVLDDGMGYEQSFDYPVTSMALTVSISTGVIYYAITGVK